MVHFSKAKMHLFSSCFNIVKHAFDATNAFNFCKTEIRVSTRDEGFVLRGLRESYYLIGIVLPGPTYGFDVHNILV